MGRCGRESHDPKPKTPSARAGLPAERPNGPVRVAAGCPPATGVLDAGRDEASHGGSAMETRQLGGTDMRVGVSASPGRRCGMGRAGVIVAGSGGRAV